jgi:hypothetical protein
MEALGWITKEQTLLNASLKVTELNQLGLHTWLGILGNVQKDIHEHHFDLMMKDIPPEEGGVRGCSVMCHRTIVYFTKNLLDKMEMDSIDCSLHPYDHTNDPVALLIAMLQCS